MTTVTAVGDWHWVDVEGKRRSASREEISALVAGGRLPRHTLVWRKGWAQWMLASQVAELAEAFPEGIATAFIEPRLDPRVVQPPAVPPGSLPARANVPAGSGAGAPQRKAMRQRPATITPVPPAAQRPGLRRRPAMPTLVEDEPMTQTGTLRPPAAVPPPPRRCPSWSRLEGVEPELEPLDTAATPVPVAHVDFVEQHRIENPAPDTREQVAAHTPSQPLKPNGPREGVPVYRKGDEAPKAGQPATVQPSASFEQPPDTRVPVTITKTDSALVGPRAVDACAHDSGHRERRSGPDELAKAGLTRALVPYAVLGVAAGLLGATALGLWSHRQEPRPSPKHATAAAAVAKPTPPPAAPCVLGRPAQRLSPAAVLSVPLNVATDPSSGNAALAFADSAAGAMGILVDPASLMVGHVFREPSGTSALEVTPLVASGRLEFVVTRADADPLLSHTVDTAQRFVVGFRGQDFESVSGAGRETVWRDVGTAKLTNPRVASVPSVGHAVTFRSGGQAGRILFGWLTDSGRAKTPLQPINAQGLVGTPTVAANDRGVLTAFAVRGDPHEPWHVELALTDFNGLPARSVRFRVPPRGPGQEAISPVAAGLPGARWLLQWTEGGLCHRDVRVQTLSHDLEPLGAAITVSPEDSNAGQGAVWVHGTSALAAFFVSSQDARELWGAALKCP